MTKPNSTALKPRLLDLYCGGGGAAMGYWLAGFEVVGVDIAKQPRYRMSRASRAGVARSSLEPCRVRLGLRQSWKDGSLRLPGTSLVGSPGCADPVEEAVSGTARGFQ